MKRLLLTLGLLIPPPPPADAIQAWQEAGSENLEHTRYVTHWVWIPHQWQELREIWRLQAIGDLEAYSRKARVWRAMYEPKE